MTVFISVFVLTFVVGVFVMANRSFLFTDRADFRRPHSRSKNAADPVRPDTPIQELQQIVSGFLFPKRRRFLQTAGAAGLTAIGFRLLTGSHADAAAILGPSIAPNATFSLDAIKQIHTDLLDVGYWDAGPADGQVVFLLHGYPYDIHSYAQVARILAAEGFRVVVPFLRGHGSTRFLDASTPRAGQQGAIGADVIALMDALKIPTAVFAGFDWGGRAACVAAALWPERCEGLISVNSYLIQDIAHAMTPVAARIESGLWYQYYFQTERGRAGLAKDRRGIAKEIWSRNSPSWRFDEATFERTALAFDNPDYVEVVIHSYRHRLGLAPGYPLYEEIERRLASLPVITVPTITLDGVSDGNYPASDGSATAAQFRGPRTHRRIRNAGHNLPQEAPKEFATAIMDLAGKSSATTRTL
jgi:pimeloyl-ACP methyl ester carboxylesterase